VDKGKRCPHQNIHALQQWQRCIATRFQDNYSLRASFGKNIVNDFTKHLLANILKGISGTQGVVKKVQISRSTNGQRFSSIFELQESILCQLEKYSKFDARL
jgi:hypothetical protein